MEILQTEFGVDPKTASQGFALYEIMETLARDIPKGFSIPLDELEEGLKEVGHAFVNRGMLSC